MFVVTAQLTERAYVGSSRVKLGLLVISFATFAYIAQSLSCEMTNPLDPPRPPRRRTSVRPPHPSPSLDLSLTLSPAPPPVEPLEERPRLLRVLEVAPLPVPTPASATTAAAAAAPAPPV